MGVPKLKPAVFINYFKVKDHFVDNHHIDDDIYWQYLINLPWFKGNDTSLGFSCEFVEQECPEEVLTVLQDFISDEVLAILKLTDKHKTVAAILELKAAHYLENYVVFMEHEEIIREALDEQYREYWNYLMAGFFEAAVIAQYQLKDYMTYKYHYYISW